LRCWSTNMMYSTNACSRKHFFIIVQLTTARFGVYIVQQLVIHTNALISHILSHCGTVSCQLRFGWKFLPKLPFLDKVLPKARCVLVRITCGTYTHNSFPDLHWQVSDNYHAKLKVHWRHCKIFVFGLWKNRGWFSKTKICLLK